MATLRGLRGLRGTCGRCGPSKGYRVNGFDGVDARIGGVGRQHIAIRLGAKLWYGKVHVGGACGSHSCITVGSIPTTLEIERLCYTNPRVDSGTLWQY